MSHNWKQALDCAVDERFAKMVEVRRWIHSHPELSGEERETSLYLYQLLGDEGFDVRMGIDGRGVLADAGSGKNAASEGRIALRADLDALRIHDAKQVDYRSRCEGKMHACGHDAHTAMVYGTMSVLQSLCRAGNLPWDVPFRGLFQPSEETCRGAQEMIEAGALEGVRAILAAHVDPTLQVGRVGLRSGLLTANCDEMQITIRGRGGHAARPHETSDPIAAAAQLINALYLYIPRVTDSQDAVVVTIGQIDGGDNANVIPEEVSLRGTVRTLDRSVRRHTMQHISRLAYGIGETSETKIQVQYHLGTHSIWNDGAWIDLLGSAVREVIGDEGITSIARPSMGSEDFAFYLDRVPGAMIRLGCASQMTGGAPLHTPLFDVDEQALKLGAKILARAVVEGWNPLRRSELVSPRQLDEDRFPQDDVVAP